MILNIFIGSIIIGITIIIQAYGTKFWIHYLKNNYLNKTVLSFNQKTVRLLAKSAIFLLLLNFIEAIIWGFTYYFLPGITEFETLERAIYFSLVTFTSVGYGDITISSASRILSGFEAMNGVLLLGWTTAVMFSIMQFILKGTLKIENKE